MHPLVVKDLKEIIGLTVDSIPVLNSKDLIIKFTNGKALFIHCFSDEIDIDSEPENYNLRDAGIITEQEYQDLQVAEQVRNLEHRKQQDLANLARLKRMYPEAF